MSGTRVLQISSLVFLALGIFLMFAGVDLKLRGLFGPGPGLFPFLVGAGLTICSIIWLVQVMLGIDDRAQAELQMDRQGIIRIVAVMASLIAFGVLMPVVGFNLSMMVLLLGLMLGFDRYHAIAKVVLAVTLSFGIHYVFETMLRVPLPYASLPALRAIGL